MTATVPVVSESRKDLKREAELGSHGELSCPLLRVVSTTGCPDSDILPQQLSKEHVARYTG